MKTAFLIVTETDELILKNFKIHCYCEHFSLCFSSGNGDAKIVVGLFGSDVIAHVPVQDWFRRIRTALRDCSASLPYITIRVLPVAE